jgi:drug/metabolite transporter (DMT)-like permease
MPTEPAPHRRDATLLWTGLALIAFATNSILCRLALGRRSIDPASFTAIRLLAGALTLWLVRAATRARGSAAAPAPRSRAGWISAATLFGYAAAFSLAYLSLGAGTGALILFGSVQATMILAALGGGERFRALEATGLIVALGGLAYLAAPGVTAPAPFGAALMATAGIAWGVYSLRGRGAADPLGDTSFNFALALPMVLGMVLISVHHLHATLAGAVLAAGSGSLASGLGYVIWYLALRGLSAIRAATVQLAVPVLAAAGGVLVLGERVTLRLVLAAVLILGGVALAIAGLGARDAAGARAATGRR